MERERERERERGLKFFLKQNTRVAKVLLLSNRKKESIQTKPRGKKEGKFFLKKMAKNGEKKTNKRQNEHKGIGEREKRRKKKMKKNRETEGEGLFVCWLLNVPATC